MDLVAIVKYVTGFRCCEENFQSFCDTMPGGMEGADYRYHADDAHRLNPYLRALWAELLCALANESPWAVKDD